MPEEGQAYVAMSQDGRIVAIATDANVNVYNADTAELMDTLEAVHSGTDIIYNLMNQSENNRIKMLDLNFSVKNETYPKFIKVGPLHLY